MQHGEEVRVCDALLSLRNQVQLDVMPVRVLQDHVLVPPPADRRWRGALAGFSGVLCVALSQCLQFRHARLDAGAPRHGRDRRHCSEAKVEGVGEVLVPTLDLGGVNGFEARLHHSSEVLSSAVRLGGGVDGVARQHFIFVTALRQVVHDDIHRVSEEGHGALPLDARPVGLEHDTLPLAPGVLRELHPALEVRVRLLVHHHG